MDATWLSQRCKQHQTVSNETRGNVMPPMGEQH